MEELWRSIGRLVRAARSADGEVSSSTRDARRMDAALSYTSPLTLREQRDQLNAAGPYAWVDRDSHWYPDYISTRCHPDYGFFRIFDAVDGRFNLTIKLVTDRAVVGTELAKLVDAARERVLPLVAADDVQPAEPYD